MDLDKSLFTDFRSAEVGHNRNGLSSSSQGSWKQCCWDEDDSRCVPMSSWRRAVMSVLQVKLEADGEQAPGVVITTIRDYML